MPPDELTMHLRLAIDNMRNARRVAAMAQETCPAWLVSACVEKCAEIDELINRTMTVADPLSGSHDE